MTRRESDSVLIQSLAVLATRALARGSAFVVLIILARWLDPDDFGFYAFAVATVQTLTMTANLGLRQSSAFFLGKNLADRSAVVSSLWTGWAALAGVLFVLAWAIIGQGPAAGVGGPTLLVAAAVVPMLLVNLGQGVYLGTGAIGLLNASDIVSRVALVGIVAGLAVAGWLSVEAAVGAFVAAHGLGAVFVVATALGGARWASVLDVGLLWRILRRGIVFATALGLIQLNNYVAIFLVSRYMAPDDVGVFFGAERLVEVFAEAATALGVVMFSRGVRADDAETAMRDSARVTRAAVVVIVLAAIVGGAFAEPLIALILGERFVAGAMSLRILLVGAVFAGVSRILYPALAAQGHAIYGIAVFLPAVIANGVLASVLIPVWGLEGAAIARAGVNFVAVAILLGVIRAKFGIAVSELLVLRRADIEAAKDVVKRFRARRAA